MAFDDLAPGYELEVANQAVPANITELISSLEVELVDGYADMVKISVANPNFILTDSPLFQPGNEINVSIGYGPNLRHVGRFNLARLDPLFPQDSMPYLEVRGYTLDHKMMDHGPENGAQRVYRDASIADAVATVAERYGMQADVDPTPELSWGQIQRSGVTDYELVKGLSNLTGFLFWVDGAANGTWTLHFKNPGDRNALANVQDTVYTFKYNNGDFTTLLSFETQFALRGAITKLKAQALNPDTGELLVAEFQDDANAPDVGYIGNTQEEIQEQHTTAGAVKLFFGDFSVDIVANKKFKTSLDVENWAAQWFRRQRENFVMGRGILVGHEAISARQTHILEGLGKTLSGEFYFSRVRHILTRESGYTIDFNARKVIK